jgi:photosystem II stability/assembly factor-like uncharacterized protein
MRGVFLLSLLLLSLFGFGQKKRKNTEPTLVNYNEEFNSVKWRSIGPFRGGRSVCATGVSYNHTTYFMGTTGGGLWKTEDIGVTWKNCSDGFFKTGSVGAVSVSESKPNIIYVGMGEHAPRGVMTHHGDGMYKSIDTGKTWIRTGLESTQHIARVLIHPENADTVLVAAQGALYSPSKERGIFLTKDGGQTWKNVLFINERTGCAELSMDHENPKIIYAAMWEHGRKPWQVISGGSGSGLYKSADGGETWTKLKNGLPEKMGKMSVAVCRSNSKKVYALIESDSEAEAGGLFVSDDGGENWIRVSNDHRLIQRAWYYIELFIDPINDQVVYVLSSSALRSRDGGTTWETLSGTHGDYHDLWINPKNPNNLIIANDGGAAISFNQGKTWSTQSNMPTAQFYRINTDNLFPYNIYGGQQDNTSVRIASREFGSYGIGSSSWSATAGGESAFLAFDPDDPRYVMGGSYQGTIEVYDSKSKAGTNIMAAPIQYLAMDAKEMKYRYNWNAPIIRSMHEGNTFYHGAQVLLKTNDMGKSWTEASPDLTRNEKEKQGKPGVPYTNEGVGAENYGTLAYVLESPLEKGVIWTGSDDGLVYLTRDGGKNWQNVTPAGLQECLINSIEVSPHDKATAYIATTRYKFNDHSPAIYKTIDYGKTWTKIVNGIPSNAFTRVVREDAVRKDLLFAGTELGIYISWNGGKEWSSFQLNLPVTPITDLKIHQGDLIAATSGRSFWILDDLALLRNYQQPSKEMIIYTPEVTMLMNGGSELDDNDSFFSGAHTTRGVNPATGMVIYYYLPERVGSGLYDLNDEGGADELLDYTKGEVLTLEIRDSTGLLLRSFSSKPEKTSVSYDGAPPANPVLPHNKGINRFVWNLRVPTILGIPNVYMENSFLGHKVPPGTYTLVLKTSKSAAFTKGVVIANPLYNQETATYQEYHQLMTEMELKISTMHHLVNKLYNKRIELDEALSHITNEKLQNLKQQGILLSEKLKKWDEEMVQRKTKAYDDVENFQNKFTANYMFLLNHSESDIPRINNSTLLRKKELDAQWTALRKQGEELLAEVENFLISLIEQEAGPIWKENDTKVFVLFHNP